MPRQDQSQKWLKLLGDEVKKNQSLFEKYPENFRLDHQDQLTIHSDCQSLEKKSPIFEENELKNALELLLTYYCKTESLAYQSGLHEVLAPFFTMRFNNLKTVYGAFCTFIQKMLPNMFAKESYSDLALKLFSNLMMYHEPIIFSKIQTSFPSSLETIKLWLMTGMASYLDSSNLLKLWEVSLTDNNLTLPIFVSIAVLYRQREKIMKKSKSKKNLLVEDNDVDDMSELIKEALVYQANTPASFKSNIEDFLFTSSPKKSLVASIESSPLLRVSAKELENIGFNFIIIDTREFKEFAKAHLSKCIHLPSEYSITTGNLEELWSILSGFSTFFSGKYSKPCHFIFVASQLEDNSNLCLDLVRRGIEKVGQAKVKSFPSHVAGCSKCKFSKELNKTCRSKDKQQILSLIWEHFLSDSLETSTRSGFSKASNAGVFVGKDRDLSETSTYECLKLMWTNHLLEAELWFDSKKEEDPRCALHFAEAGFLKALLLGDSSSKEIVIERLAATERSASEMVKIWKPKGLKVFSNENLSKPQIFEVIKCSQKLRLSLVVKAEATLFKSGTELLQRKLTTGTANFKKAWKLYQKAKKMTEACFVLAGKKLTTAEINDMKKGIEADILNLVKFGEGVIILGLSMAPRRLSKVTKVAIGIEIDQSQGIKSLYDCINAKVGIRVPLALMFLTFWLVIYIPEYVPGQKERLREAHDLIRFSLHYYPQSPFFYWLESYMNQKQGNLERSLKLLNRVISKTHKLGMTMVPGRLNFERGWVLFLCHEWIASARCLNEAVKSGSSSPFVQLLIGVCHCMNGSLAEGQAILEELEKGSENLTERWASRRACRYLQRRRFQLFPFEIMYITDSLTSLKPEWLESALDYLGHISMEIESFEEIEEKVTWLLIRGTIFRLMGRLQQSAKSLHEALSYETQVRDEVWVIPHTNYELAMNYSKSRDWSSASKYVKEARGFKKKFEFANSLMFKLNSLMDLVLQEENREFNK